MEGIGVLLLLCLKFFKEALIHHQYQAIGQQKPEQLVSDDDQHLKCPGPQIIYRPGGFKRVSTIRMILTRQKAPKMRPTPKANGPIPGATRYSMSHMH